MPTKSNTSIAKDFFLYLFNTGVLYFSAVSFITLIFQYIEHLIPDPLRTYYSGEVFNGPMRFAISSLIILFPVYILTARWLSKDLDKNPAKRELWVRRWLIYVTLFITAITIVVDLITLLNYFLGGDFTLRFGLKVLTVLIVAGAVFAYYLFSLKREPGTGSATRKAFMWVSIIIVGASIIGAFFIVGSPQNARLAQYDQQRVRALQAIDNDINVYYQEYERLPERLEDLGGAVTFNRGETYLDPVTEEPYQYRSLGGSVYELCATFDLPSNEKEPYYDYFNWTHGKGRTCFTRTLPELNNLPDPDTLPEPKPVPVY